MATKNYFYAIGRRKSATARVRLMTGKGSIIINDKPSEEYFANSAPLLQELQEPFKAIDKSDYSASVRVSGGGHSAQVGAIKLGIARALVVMNEDLKSTLRKAELLGRDSREKERKKFGLKGARKQRQFTKR